MSPSSPSLKIVTPGDAGKRAAELAAAASRQSSSSSSMDTLLAHAGVSEDVVSLSSRRKQGHTNLSLAPSLEFATTYTRPPEGPYHEGDAIYTRIDNPTRRLLEETVGKLECQGASATAATSSTETKITTAAFSSGMMAASSIVLAHSTPITVLLPRDLYHGVSTMMMDVFQERFGVAVHRVDLHTITTNEGHDNNRLTHQITSALEQQNYTGSVLVWMETPSNPCCHVIDISMVCNIVHQMREKIASSNDENNNVKLTTVVDSTLAPPVIQQPLKLGADLVMHSGTKYFGGHSDVLLGLVTASPWTKRGQQVAPLVRQVQLTMGGVASPMDSWLTLRGMRTLHLRVERQCQTAMTLAKHLYHCMINGQQQEPASPLITAVHYPGLESHPNHAIAQKQMTNDGFGGVLSIEFATEHLAMAFCGAVQTMYRATSLGGTETLVEHRASIEPPHRVVSPPGLVRMSVGLEDATDLIQDLDRALAIVQQIQQEMRQ